MADYFVDPASGSDSTGDGSAANPWKTVDKAIGSGKAVGSTLSTPVNLWIAGGSVARETVVASVIPSESAPLRIIGDYDGAAFGAAGVANPKTGPVTITGVAADGTPIGGATLNLGRAHVSVERLRVVNGGGTGNHAIHFHSFAGPRALRDCEIVRHGSGMAIFCDPYVTNVAQDWLIERCVIFTGFIVIDVSGTFAAGSRLVVRSSRIVSLNLGARIHSNNLEMTIQNSAIFARENLVSTTFGAGSGIVRIYGSILSAGSVALSAATLGQIVENGNLIAASSTPRSNVAAGANSQVVGDLELNLGRFGDYMAPLAGSRAVGWGSYGTTPALDLYGRPFNALAPACGPVEWVDPTPPDPEPGGNTYIFQTEG